jgi:hypothetical protein
MEPTSTTIGDGESLVPNRHLGRLATHTTLQILYRVWDSRSPAYQNRHRNLLLFLFWDQLPMDPFDLLLA